MPSFIIFFSFFFRGFAVPDSQAIEARTLMSPLRTILLGATCIFACAALALFEFYVLQAFGFALSATWFALLLAAHIVPLAVIVLRLGRFERRWFASGSGIALALLAGVVLLVQSFLSLSFEPLHSSLREVATPDVIEVAPSRPSSPPPNVPMAPIAAPDQPGQVQAPAKELPQRPAKNGKVAHLDAAPDLPRRPPPAPVPAPRAESPATVPLSPPVVPAAPVPSPTFTPLAAPGPASPPAIGKLQKAEAAGGGFFADAARPDIGLTKKGQLGPPIDVGGLIAKPPSPDVPRPPIDHGVPSTLAPQPASPEPFNTSAYWNSWFVDGSGPASNILIANNTYTFTLDMAAFDYAALRQKTQSSGVRVDKAFDSLIDDPTIGETIINIKPLVPEGSGLRLMDNQNFYRMKVDLRKIRQPNADAAKQYAEGALSITEFSKQASAGSIQITVTAESKGCATIAFAIFRGLLPLDHLVQRVSIGETGTSAPVCDSADPAQANALSGGLDSLREVSLGMEGSGASATAAAALHIFDFDSYSMAVFVDGRPGKNQTVYGWQTASSVVEFLKADHFQNLILKARSDSADKKPASYVRAAQDLSTVLFSTKPGNTTEDEAKNAFAAFRAVVRDTPGSPVIVVRVASAGTSGQNRSIYVPLGILGASGKGAVLEKPILVVQPMAIERYPSRDKCIGDWMFAVPEALEKVSETIMPRGFFPANIPGRRISDIEKLREYLAAASGTAVPMLAASPAAVGFVVLAHQDEGIMWFAESTDHIMPQHIGKKFPSGSVGIFAACSAAAAKGRNSALLQRLNEQGVDTLIASPFTIDAGYGVVFASSFAEIVAEIKSDKSPPTILELFDKTVSRTAQKFKDRTDGEYGELGLEYVLLGNPAIRLCVPPPSP